MRLFFRVLLILVLPACSQVAGDSGFGNRLVPASCIADAAPWILGDTPGVSATAEAALNAAPALRAVTYNIHSGLGPERAFRKSRASVERHLNGIADAIARAPEAVDVVALNEVDFDARRSGGFDQALFLAEALKQRTGSYYQVIYGETWRRDIPGFEVRFGNAVLVRHPVLDTKACLFDDTTACGLTAAEAGMPPLRASGAINRFAREARGIIKVTIDFAGHPVDVIVTHLDAFVLPEREAQASHLLRRFVDPKRTTLVLGDFNAVPTVMTYTRAFFAADRTHDILTSGRLADARVLYDSRRGKSDFRTWATFPSAAPEWPLDTVLASLDLVPRDVKVIATPHSDHYGFYVEYRVPSNSAVIAEQRERHDAIRRRQYEQIVRCDLVTASPPRLNWLMTGTGFVDVATAVERKVQAEVPPAF